jgi:NADH:ubiquinone oxidoreductase subunit 6 (subunit J)
LINLGESVFILILFLTIAGALTTVLSGSIIYAMLGLVATMFGMAGLYIYLNAPFLAMMQILIYVGAITILIAFAIMLAGPFYKKPKEWSTVGKFIASIVVSIFSFFMFFSFIMRVSWYEGKGAFSLTTKDIGRALFDRYAFPFELISLVIVVSIVGAIMLAIFSRGKK